MIMGTLNSTLKFYMPVLTIVPTIKSACLPRLVQLSHLHTSPNSQAPVPALPEKGGKTRHGIIPEEIFQLLYPKTGVTGQQNFHKPRAVFRLEIRNYM